MEQKIVFVSPWFGDTIPGGAERATRDFVSHLAAQKSDVMVATTCARDFYNWNPYHAPGLSDFNGVPVQRFPLDARNADAFDRVNSMLLAGRPISAFEESIFLQNVVSSQALNRFLWRNRNEYVFVFTPYMFGTTYWGVKLVHKRSFIFPCLHDEPYLMLPRYRSMLTSVCSLLFYSKGEAILAEKVLDLEGPLNVIGIGIEIKEQPSKQERLAFIQKYGLEDGFVFLPGRKQPEKNTDLAVDYFLSFKRRRPCKLKLLLSGPGSIDLEPALRDQIVDLGYMDRSELACAYSAAQAVLIPSSRESFSFTMYEAWVYKRPVLVHQSCPATTIPVSECQGGKTFSSAEDFGIALGELASMEEQQRHNLGERGYAYVQKYHTWDHVLATFLGALENSLA